MGQYQTFALVHRDTKSRHSPSIDGNMPHFRNLESINN